MTEYHRLGGLNSGLLCLEVLHAGKSNIKVPAKHSVYGENSLPALQPASFSLCPRVVGTDRMLSGASSTRTLILRTSLLGPYLTLITYLPICPVSKCSHIRGLGLQNMNFGKHNSAHSRELYMSYTFKNVSVLCLKNRITRILFMVNIM